MPKRIVFIFTIVLFSFAITAVGHAINPPDDDGIAVLCIFTDPDVNLADNFLDPVPAGGPIYLYFVLYHPQGVESLSAIEFAWHLEPEPASPLLVLGWIWPAGAGALNVGDDHNLIVGFGNGVDFGGADHVTIGTLQLIFISNPGVTEIFLGPTSTPQIPGVMSYNGLPMIPYSVDGLYENPVFGFNTHGPIATEAITWGEVKSLFR